MSGPSNLGEFQHLVSGFNPGTGALEGATLVTRRLSDMRGCFFDTAAFDALVQNGDPVLYTVANIEPAKGQGDLGYALGRILPGRVGREYFMTKGHFHAWREAAEVYVGLEGDGMMLLEKDGESRALPLRPNSVLYVPGHTAHRTMNVGTNALVYLGIYPVRAGHDYGAIAARNFRKVLVEREDKPALIDREELYGSAPR